MLLRFLAFVVGIVLVARAIASAVRVFVLPRASNEPIARFVFTGMNRLFRLVAKPSKPYAFRDRVMAYYAPVSLLVLPIVWLSIVLIGYTAIFWSFGADRLSDAFRISGSSLFTLGFAPTAGTAEDIAAFSEAGIGLLLLALLIAYLPTMYASFSRRELAVNLLEVRADTPPSAIAMMQRFHRLGRMDHFHGQLELWETWFADIAESHTSLAALAFFRSPQRDHSWVNAAGAIMDGAAMYRSIVDVPKDIQADLTIRAGYLALRRIADFFRHPVRARADRGDAVQHQPGGLRDRLRRAGRQGHRAQTRPRPGLARLPRLAGQLRPDAARPRPPHDGPTRALERPALGGHRTGQSGPDPPVRRMIGTDRVRTIGLDGPLDLRRTLAPLWRGRGDPTMRMAPDGVWRATRTPDGPGTIHLAHRGGDARG